MGQVLGPGRVFRTAMVFVSLLMGAPVLGDECVETKRLVVCDVSSGELPNPRAAELAAAAEHDLQALVAFWPVDDGLGRFGKIRLELGPARRGFYASEFRTERGFRPRRVIRVWGAAKEPQELVHKLNVALFPTADKLVRNMMGGAMEARFGNRRSFPGCGFDAASWVLVLRRAGDYVPLEELTTEHSSWGMAMGPKGWLYPTDRRRQHASYAEAVAFGEFLIERYGKERLADFYRRAQAEGGRPWSRVYGKDLAALEREWIAELEAGQAGRNAEVASAASLWAATGDSCPSQREE